MPVNNIPGSPVSILMIFILLLYLIFNVFGVFLKSKRSNGVVKKKFLHFSVGNLLFIVFFLLEVLIPIAIVRPFMRIGEISGILIVYRALREVPEKSVQKPAKKEVKVEDGLFRLLKRPAQITEEEVIFHMEKKICLVCKGKVGGFNTYICTSCNVLYCETCAKTLANLENVCWVCDSAIDPSKPVELYEKEEGEEIKVSKEAPEKPEILDVPPKK
ncbi:unnamed protein product [marine sediment metagenome]|uniref:Uncharacterized protein n=1 Tax=marine sediment metagenome TaxID=412755 RepID=X0YVS1_9ZZZZ